MATVLDTYLLERDAASRFPDFGMVCDLLVRARLGRGVRMAIRDVVLVSYLQNQ